MVHAKPLPSALCGKSCAQPARRRRRRSAEGRQPRPLITGFSLWTTPKALGGTPWPLPFGNPNVAARYPPPIAAGAKRFAALSAAARHAWLAAHLGALRAGQISLAQLP